MAITFYPAALHALLDSTSGPVGRDLARRATAVQNQAKALCPVDSGRLRSSITYALGSDGRGLFADVGSNVEYAVFVELGTSRMSAQPYLLPALRAAG